MSQLEVEVKLHLNEQDIPLLKQSILSLYPLHTFERVDKHDLYFVHPQYPSKVRLRIEKEMLHLTTKQKSIDEQGFESNNEIELPLEVDKQQKTLLFLSSLGYSYDYEKTKVGFGLHIKELTIEIVEVGPLGWFLEIEILSEKDESSVTQSKNRLDELLTLLHLDKKSIEQRPYEQLLKERV
ncbi:MAG: class IV adenylate cyclase [Sphaerochaetaceae bacterium]|jgi:predicted adenylyl cyclase CyaB